MENTSQLAVYFFVAQNCAFIIVKYAIQNTIVQMPPFKQRRPNPMIEIKELHKERKP